VSAKNWDIVFAGMSEVMRADGRGTGKTVSKGADYTMAGKTGSAQVVSYAQNVKYTDTILKAMDERLRDHALFVAFAPVEAPEIAIAVMVENGMHGASFAGPVVRYVFDAHLRGKYLKLNQPLPAIDGAPEVAPAVSPTPNTLLEEQEDRNVGADDDREPTR
jgi:penicillin-binding protein 2